MGSTRICLGTLCPIKADFGWLAGCLRCGSDGSRVLELIDKLSRHTPDHQGAGLLGGRFLRQVLALDEVAEGLEEGTSFTGAINAFLAADKVAEVVGELSAVLMHYVRVEVPVQVQCRAPEVTVPVWTAAGLRKTDSLEVKVRVLLVERRQRIGYEKQLQAAMSACH